MRAAGEGPGFLRAFAEDQPGACQRQSATGATGCRTEGRGQGSRIPGASEGLRLGGEPAARRSVALGGEEGGRGRDSGWSGKRNGQGSASAVRVRRYLRTHWPI